MLEYLKTLWKKYRAVLISAWLVWSVLSIALLCLFYWVALDRTGGFQRVSYDWKMEIDDLDAVQQVLITAENVTLEFAESDTVQAAIIALYGEGYMNQKAHAGVTDGVLVVSMNDTHPVGKLVLRVIVPGRQERLVQIRGNHLDVHARQLWTEEAEIAVTHGMIDVQDSMPQRLQIESWDSVVRLENNQLKRLSINNAEGDTILLANRCRLLQIESLHGNIDIGSKSIKGVWQLESKYGDVSITTKQKPYDLLLDVESAQGLTMTTIGEGNNQLSVKTKGAFALMKK